MAYPIEVLSLLKSLPPRGPPKTSPGLSQQSWQSSQVPGDLPEFTSGLPESELISGLERSVPLEKIAVRGQTQRHCTLLSRASPRFCRALGTKFPGAPFPCTHPHILPPGSASLFTQLTNPPAAHSYSQLHGLQPFS